MVEQTGCPIHSGAVHGGEAEELRSGIETLISKHRDGTVPRRELIILLDLVDARDSLAHLERGDIQDIVRRLRETSERAPDVRAVPMRLVHQSVFDELLAAVSP